MGKIFAPLRRAKTLSVMPTYQCTAACKHCGTYSSPKQTTFLDPELMLKAIEQAAQSGYKVVVFTGGEATLAEDALLRGIRLASSHGICTRIVTNAWWATDEQTADQFLKKLLEAGLVEINFSTGDQHTRFVPLENVLWASRAAAKIPMKTNVIMVETFAGRALTKHTVKAHSIYKSIRRDYPKASVRINESPWMPLSPGEVGHYAEGMSTTKKNLPVHTGCSSCMGTTTLQADGRIAACCGIGMRAIPELQVGHISSMSLTEADEVMENDFLKRWIRIEGPEKILAWAATHDPSIQWEGMYAHHCQSCVRLYRDPKVRAVILEHHQEKMADVLMAEWLLYHYDHKVDAIDDSGGEGFSDSAHGPSHENLSAPQTSAVVA